MVINHYARQKCFDKHWAYADQAAKSYIISSYRDRGSFLTTFSWLDFGTLWRLMVTPHASRASLALLYNYCFSFWDIIRLLLVLLSFEGELGRLCRSMLDYVCSLVSLTLFWSLCHLSFDFVYSLLLSCCLRPIFAFFQCSIGVLPYLCLWYAKRLGWNFLKNLNHRIIPRA